MAGQYLAFQPDNAAVAGCSSDLGSLTSFREELRRRTRPKGASLAAVKRRRSVATRVIRYKRAWTGAGDQGNRLC